MRVWLKRALVAAIAAVGLVAAAITSVIGPFVRDDLALDRTVRIVALDWRDFGPDRAHERLQYELDHQGIGAQVGDEDCALDDLPPFRRVSCRWTAHIPVPATRVALPLTFHSQALLTDDGDIL